MPQEPLEKGVFSISTGHESRQDRERSGPTVNPLGGGRQAGTESGPQWPGSEWISLNATYSDGSREGEHLGAFPL